MDETLTTAQAAYLYSKGLAILKGTWNLTTRHAFYAWDVDKQVYEVIHTGLRVVHTTGARWNGHRFVPCACEHCKRSPSVAAQVDIAGYEPTETY